MRAIALYDYTAADASQLSVRWLDRLTLLEPEADGWVLCESATVDGAGRGYVPAAYVQVDETEPAESVVSGGSFTTVAESRANQPTVAAAGAIGRRLSGDLSSSLTRRQQPSHESDDVGTVVSAGTFTTVAPSAAARPGCVAARAIGEGLNVAVAELGLRTAEPAESVVSTVSPWDSISCVEQRQRPATLPLRPPAGGPPPRGIRLVAGGGSERVSARQVRVVRPDTFRALLELAQAKLALLWPAEPPSSQLVVSALIDEDGCAVDEENFALLHDGDVLVVERGRQRLSLTPRATPNQREVIHRAAHQPMAAAPAAAARLAKPNPFGEAKPVAVRGVVDEQERSGGVSWRAHR